MVTSARRFDPLGGAFGAAERQRRATAFDTTRSWVDPNGHRLSDRVWLARQEARRAIDQTLTRAIATGEGALVVANALEHYLQPEIRPARDAAGNLIPGQPRRIVTPTPNPPRYATIMGNRRTGGGSYAARRLTRSEMTRTHGQATLAANTCNPFSQGSKWNTSGSHKGIDRCDIYASHDEGFGRGVYPHGQFPSYPAHPHCRCFITSVQADTASVVRGLRSAYGLDAGPPAGVDPVAYAAGIRAVSDGLIAELFLAWQYLNEPLAA